MCKGKLIKGYIFIIISAIIFGTMPLMATHIYSEGVNPITLVFLRNSISLPALALLAMFSGNSLKIPFKALPSLGILAVMGCCITPILLFSSYKFMDSGTATVFHFIYPAVVVTGEFVFMKSRFKSVTLISLVMCIVGIGLFYNPSGNNSISGSVIALLSGVTYAIYVLLLSGFKYKEISGFVFSFYVALICSAILFVVCLCSGSFMLPVSLKGWILSAIFAVAVNVGAVVLFQKGTFVIGGGRASILSTLEPITSIIAGALFMNENIGLIGILGSVLVIGAGIIIGASDIKIHKENNLSGGKTDE